MARGIKEERLDADDVENDEFVDDADSDDALSMKEKDSEEKRKEYQSLASEEERVAVTGTGAQPENKFPFMVNMIMCHYFDAFRACSLVARYTLAEHKIVAMSDHENELNESDIDQDDLHVGEQLEAPSPTSYTTKQLHGAHTLHCSSSHIHPTCSQHSYMRAKSTLVHRTSEVQCSPFLLVL